jgi:hypothetical protein
MPQDIGHQSRDGDYTDESMKRALGHYQRELRAELEAQCPNQYVRLDPETGDYAIGRTRGDVRAAFKSQFGTRVAWTIHID